MKINAVKANKMALESDNYFENAKVIYWNKIQENVELWITNAAKEGGFETTFSVEKQFLDYAKFKIEESGFIVKIHPANRNDTSAKITVSWKTDGDSN